MSSSASSSATAYEVSVGGTSMKQTERDGVQSMVFEDHMDMVDMFSIRLGGAEEQPAWNFKISDEVSVKLGTGTTDLFSGEVVAMEPGYQVDGTSSMQLRALDKMHRLGRGRKTRFWNDMKDSDVAQEVGAESGLPVDADDTSEILPYILQRNETNVAFLKRLAARNNYALRVQDGKLLFKKTSFQGTPAKITMGDSLRSMRMSFNSMDQVQQVIVRGWDISKKEEIVGTATLGDITSIGGGQLGAQVSSAFGDATAYVTDVPVSSQAMANQIAKAELERLARQFCHGSCSVSGSDKIRSGTMVEFDGLSAGCNGKFFVMASRHIISNRTGYTTEFTFCSNTLGS